MVRVLVAVAVFLVLLYAGTFFLKSFGQTIPPPPTEGDLRKVDRRYKCVLCGAEVRMTLAASEDPIPPRHCMEEMDLVRVGDT